jgi:ATP-binding cassette subfamily B protein
LNVDFKKAKKMSSKTSTNPSELPKPKRPNIFQVVSPYRRWIIILVVFALISNGVNLVIPKIISHAIDNFSAGNFTYSTVVTQFLIATFIIFVFALLQGIVQTYVSEKAARDLRTGLAAKISEQSFSFIREANPSKLLTNLTSDIDSIKMFVSMGIVSLVSSAFIIVGASALLISIDWELALIILLILPLIGGAFFIVFKRLGPLFKKSRELIDGMNKVINESILGAALVRVMNAQMLEYNKFFEANTDRKNVGIAIVRLFATLIPIVMFVGNLASLIILLLGGHFVITGDMSLGDFSAFISYMVLLIFPIMVIGFISNFMAEASVAYGRIQEVMNAPETADTGTEVVIPRGNIELKDVSLSFDEKPVLKDINLQIKAGATTAIIGPTAAGKSQLLYLLTGLMKPDKGEILFEGVSLENIDKQNFRHHIGMVFQDSIIFNLSLRENIAFNEKVTDELMSKAIETAELSDFVDALPQGLDTVVSERGNSLSGGQKQRVMLARALAINPAILLLDDFTARVDQQTEQKILANVRKNYPDITLISVTQKIASVQDYDQIVLLEEGDVLATGTHAYLMHHSPEYVQIYNSQRSTNEIEIEEGLKSSSYDEL